MLRLVLGEEWPHVTTFIAFLEKEESVKSVNADLWKCFFDFSLHVPRDCLGYDEASSSWPYLLDEYCAKMCANEKPSELEEKDKNK